MPTNVKVDDLKINKLTKAQYEAAVQGGTIGEYELSVLTDDNTYATSEQLTQGLATKQDTISDLATIRSGAAAGATAVQPSAIADMETQTHASATYATKTELADKQDIIQYSTMPTASTDNVDDIVQFVGTTDSTYTNGHFYKCVSDGQDPATYSWEEVSLGGSSLPDQTGQSGKFLTTDGTDASWATINALTNNSTGFASVSILGIANAISNSVAVGQGTLITRDGGIAIGQGANSRNYGSVAVGQGSYCEGDASVGVGRNVQATGASSVAIGYSARTQASNSIAIGSYTRSSAVRAIQIGSASGWTENNDANTVKFGNANGNFEIMSADGTIPEARLADTTNAQEGDALTLNSSGNAVWTNMLQYVLGGLQTTDSSKVGYLQYYFEENNAVNAPAGGQWLVLNLIKVNTSNGVAYVFSADFTSPVGSIVAGGTQIAAARSGYTTRALLLKVA